MVDLVPKNAGEFKSGGLGDALLIGGVKAVEERALIPVIGNGTLKSGAVKLVAGAAIGSMLKGKSGQIVGSAFAIDAVEDLVNGLIGTATNTGGSQEAVW